MRDRDFIQVVINIALTLAVFLIVLFKTVAINDELVAARAETAAVQTQIIEIQEQLVESQTQVQVYEAIIRGIYEEW